jgi:hypothetical protein
LEADMPTCTTAPDLGQELAGPLSAVLRALDEAPDSLTPAVASAALILAAEQLTAEAEACPVCPGLPGLCPACTELSGRAVSLRLAGEQR